MQGSQSAELPGTYGDFVVRGELGRGAMGRVFAVEDRRSGELLALKTLSTVDAELERSLKREFRTLAELQHPNLVTFHELFGSAGPAYFTMELVNGVHFDTAFRSPTGTGPANHERVLSLLHQLIDGVEYLHRAGVLHRDLKPSNVLVDSADRVVLLDFGLSLPLKQPLALTEHDVAGTFPYMAPEVFLGETRAPESDWYAVGVMLYEALSGALPFESERNQILSKQLGKFKPLDQVVEGLPPDLVRVVHDLLAPSSAARPDAAAIRALLPAPQQVSRPSSIPHRPSGGDFVGREGELDVLRQAYDALASGTSQLVLAEGRSGEGKTTLVERFISELGEHPLVLRGRCHPSEFMTYKALDAVVDTISDYLVALGSDADALLDEYHVALTRVFPVLARLKVVDGDTATLSGTDAQLRRDASTGLRNLIQRISAERAVVVWIDDLQWGQEDSAALLLELFRPPCATRALFVLSFRSDERETSACLQHLVAALRSSEFSRLTQHHIELFPLGPDLSKALATRLLRTESDLVEEQIEAYAERVAREAEGNPFMLFELAQHVAASSHIGNVSSATSLSDVLDQRVERLPSQARALLELVATTGRPVGRDLLIALTDNRERVSTLLTMMVKGALLRMVNTSGEVDYLVYHDRIREWVLRGLPAGRSRELHARIAEGLLRLPAADPEQVLEHLLHAGENARAAPFAYRAAEQAERTLAFERARQLYHLALELGFRDAPRAVVLSRLAEAAANAGRGREAAESFLAALDASQDTGLLLRDRNVLRVRAAEAYLHAGHQAEGRQILSQLLLEVGVNIPTSARQALRRSLLRRIWLNLRGRRYRLREAAEIPAEELERIDLLWAGATGLVMVHHTIADSITVELLVAALRVGERSRIARALAFEAATEALIGGPFAKRSHATLKEAEVLIGEPKDDYDRAWLLQSASSVHWFQTNWRMTVGSGDEALRIFRALRRGTQWERATVQTFRLAALGYLGEYARLREEVPPLMRDALDRGDEFALTHVADGWHLMPWLAADQPDQVLAWGERAIAPWRAMPYSGAHYRNTVSCVQTLLYIGEARAAVSRIEHDWAGLKSSQLLHASFIGTEVRFLRAHAALALFHQTEDRVERAHLLKRAKRLRRQLLGRGCYTSAVRGLLDAALGLALGKRVEPMTSIRSAGSRFNELFMRPHAHACELVAAHLANDAPQVASGRAALRAFGVVHPDKFAVCLTGLPLGFDAPQSQHPRQ